MFGRTMIVSLSIAACAAPHAKRLPDGSYAIECDAQKVCLDRAERQCGSAGYRIIDGQHDQQVVGVDGNERSVGKDRLHIRCKSDPNSDTSEPSAPSAPVPPPTEVVSNDKAPKNSAVVCRPGETQKCVGAGACVGGQACKADGSGFEQCDCGRSPVPGSGKTR